MDILGILDLDGVFFRKTFICRELAFASLHGSDHYNVKFHPDFPWTTITEKERKALFFVSRRITGLPVRARYSERALPQAELEQVFTEIYEQQVKIYGCKTVAYRGGDVERNLLTKLGIPSMDLADHLCPKFDELILDAEYSNDHDCGHHVKASAETYHCASVEVEAFKLWIRTHIL